MLVFIFFLYPETSDYTLEEVAIVFDGVKSEDLYAENKLNEEEKVVENRVEATEKIWVIWK